MDHLLATIQRLTGHQAGSKTAINQTVNSPTPSTGTLFSGNAAIPGLTSDIDIEEGARQWRQVEVYKTYLHKFIEMYAKSGHEIASFLADYDEAKALELAHKLKGVAANLALKKVASQAGSLEADLKQGQFSFESIDLLQLAIDRACAAINTYAPSVENQNQTASLQTDQANSAELIKLLQQLIAALDQDNPALVEPVLLKLEGKFPSQALAEIQGKLSLFDFRGSETLALALLKKIQDNG